MTTKVTIDAHAGWPVKVVLSSPKATDVDDTQEEVVPANTTRDFYIHDSQNIVLIEEMKRED